MDIDAFNVGFEHAMEKITAENKAFLYLVILIDEFYNVICTNLLVPHITLPTRITCE